MNTRKFIALLNFDEDIASRYDEVNGGEYTAPGDFLEHEFEWLRESGITLEDWALIDDSPWEQYIQYLIQWVLDHSSEEYEGMRPLLYDEWKDTDI